MAKVAQTHQQLLTHLQEQIGFLSSSATQFDKGFEAEAKRMAVSLRVLLHDTRTSSSLLRQLGVKSESGDEASDIVFADTSRSYNPYNLLEKNSSFNGLVALLMTKGQPGRSSRYMAPLGSPAHGRILAKPFHDWWNKVVFIGVNQQEFTRRDLVLNVANTDGGVHVDPELDEKYSTFKNGDAIAWKLVRKDQQFEIPGLITASIRQITHEVLMTLDKAYPEHFGRSQQKTES